MPEPDAARPRLTKFLNAMMSAAVGYGRSGYFVNGPYGPNRFHRPSYVAPRWHPDRLMLPPLSAEERAVYAQLTGLPQN